MEFCAIHRTALCAASSAPRLTLTALGHEGAGQSMFHLVLALLSIIRTQCDICILDLGKVCIMATFGNETLITSRHIYILKLVKGK